MNRVAFQQTGGFPLETDTLNFLQTALASMQVLSALAGDNYILSGCAENGPNVSNGYVVMNGELLEFRGGLKTDNIIVMQEVAQKPFENGQTKDVFFTRFATFGVGDDAVAWDSMVRFKTLSMFRNLPHQFSSAINSESEETLATSKAVKLLADKIDGILPSGCILIYKGAVDAIPNGFKLCNGENGTPDLRDKFVLGAGNKYAVGSTGGTEEEKLETTHLPKHKHAVPFTAIGSNAYGGGSSVGGRSYDSGSQPAFSNSLTSEAGGDQPHNNMPPYFALAYIMKI